MTEDVIAGLAKQACRDWGLPPDRHQEVQDLWVDRFEHVAEREFRAVLADAAAKSPLRFPNVNMLHAMVKERRTPPPAAHRPMRHVQEPDWGQREQLEAARQAAESAAQHSAWAAGYPDRHGRVRPHLKSVSECARWAEYWRELAETYAAEARGDVPPNAHVDFGKLASMLGMGGTDPHAAERARSLANDQARDFAA